MIAHRASPEKLLEQAKIMQDAGADVVYCVDSAGALTTKTVRDRVECLVAGLDVPVGLHAHENLSMSVANSLTALDSGALHIDACTAGSGAGAGNCPTEVFVAVCDRMGLDTGVDTMTMVDVAEDVVRPAMNRPQVVDRAALILGYAGVYSSFMLHAERAAKRYNVPQKEILMELGRRRVVGGQEDMIIDVALELAAKK
jgi:4-hydroxy 2-oxovalerate aldolase